MYKNTHIHLLFLFTYPSIKYFSAYSFILSLVLLTWYRTKTWLITFSRHHYVHLTSIPHLFLVIFHNFCVFNETFELSYIFLSYSLTTGNINVTPSTTPQMNHCSATAMKHIIQTAVEKTPATPVPRILPVNEVTLQSIWEFKCTV